jgi:hypothetical protein
MGARSVITSNLVISTAASRFLRCVVERPPYFADAGTNHHDKQNAGSLSTARGEEAVSLRSR